MITSLNKHAATDDSSASILPFDNRFYYSSKVTQAESLRRSELVIGLNGHPLANYRIHFSSGMDMCSPEPKVVPVVDFPQPVLNLEPTSVCRTLTAIGNILHPAEIERYCRLSLKLHPKKNCALIRLAIEASVLHGNDWFNGLPILQMVDGRADPFLSVDLRKRLEELGIAECQFDKGQYKLRLLGDMIDINHHHGQRALCLRPLFKKHYQARTSATPMAALLIIGVHTHQISRSDELRRFLQLDTSKSSEMKSLSTYRLLKRLVDDGIVTTISYGARDARSYLVLPVQGVKS